LCPTFGVQFNLNLSGYKLQHKIKTVAEKFFNSWRRVQQQLAESSATVRQQLVIYWPTVLQITDLKIL